MQEDVCLIMMIFGGCGATNVDDHRLRGDWVREGCKWRMFRKCGAFVRETDEVFRLCETCIFAVILNNLCQEEISILFIRIDLRREEGLRVKGGGGGVRIHFNRRDNDVLTSFEIQNLKISKSRNLEISPISPLRARS